MSDFEFAGGDDTDDSSGFDLGCQAPLVAVAAKSRPGKRRRPIPTSSGAALLAVFFMRELLWRRDTIVRRRVRETIRCRPTRF